MVVACAFWDCAGRESYSRYQNRVPHQGKRAACELGETPAGLELATHLFIERQPVIIMPLSQTVSLHLLLLIRLTLRVLRNAIEAVPQGRGPSTGWPFAYSLAATLSVEIAVEPVPFYKGSFIGWHYHTIAARNHAIVRILQTLVPAHWATANKREWALLGGIMATLNRVAVLPPAEERQFKADARAFVSLTQKSFLGVSISPELHLLFSHSREFMGR